MGRFILQHPYGLLKQLQETGGIGAFIHISNAYARDVSLGFPYAMFFTAKLRPESFQNNFSGFGADSCHINAWPDMPDIHRTGISGRRKYHAAGHIIKHNIKAMGFMSQSADILQT